MIYLVGLATILSTLLGGLFAIRLKDKLHLVLGFSAGAVLGVALFDLLPETFALTSGSPFFDKTPLLIALGFIVYMIFDRFFVLHCHSENHCENPGHRGKLGAGTLILHSFLDGLGIGLAFKVSPEVGWVVAAAVLTHDFSDGINTVNMILKNGGSRKTALQWLILGSVAPFLGIIATLFFTVSSSVLGFILAILTGLFLYLGASDLIPESHHRHPTIWTTVSSILGIAALYLAISLLG